MRKPETQQLVDAYFTTPDRDPRMAAQVESMYQAFKARLALEFRLTGGSNEGAIYGGLEDRGIALTDPAWRALAEAISTGKVKQS